MSDIGNKTIMAKNIIKYMGMNGETRKDLCSFLKVPYTTVSNWINANTYPRIDKIEMMAAHWGIRKSDLVEEKPTPGTESGPIDQLDAQLMEFVKQLTQDQKKLLLAQIKILQEQQ